MEDKVKVTDEQKNVHDMLQERVRLKISIIGIGNAGNQLLNEAMGKEGFKIFAINSSWKDLQNSVVDSSIDSFIIGDQGRGAAKYREVSKKAFNDSKEKMASSVPAFDTICNYADVIVVAGATGGGTGSGVCPEMIRYLKEHYPRKIVIFAGILPRLSSSVHDQENSIGCMKEIDELGIPYILADLEHYSGVNNDVAYKDIQQYLMKCIEIIAGKYLQNSTLGMIDENDMRVIIGQPGYMSIYGVENVKQTTLDTTTLQSLLIEKIKNSPAAPIMRDRVIRQMGVILDVASDMHDPAMASDYKELTEYIGRPITIYENYSNVSQANAQMFIILSGQTQPYNRINQMKEIADEGKENLNKVKKFDLESMVKDSITANETIPDFLL